MWLDHEVLYPRFLKSLLWTIGVLYALVNGVLLLALTISLHPISNIKEWMLYSLHWKTILNLAILFVSIAYFGISNLRCFVLEKHINSTRFEKICRSLSPYCLQHVLSTMVLGGLSAYCYDSLLNIFEGKSTFVQSWLTSANEFERSFIIGHGCFTGLMFILKYFICNMYLIQFTLDQKPKSLYIQLQCYDLLKESFFCVIKAVHWYYLSFVILGSPLKFVTFSYLGHLPSENESIIYNLLNPKLFLACIFSGVMISFTWSLYLTIFNAFASERYKFPVTIPHKGDENRTLVTALACKESSYLKYLAVLDFRLLAQSEPDRRQQIFSISHPGGHPRVWKAISSICINLLKEYVHRLSEYSFAAAAASDPKNIPQKKLLAPKALYQQMRTNFSAETPEQSLTEKVFSYFREKPAVSYFFDELPNAKLMKLFASSQPLIWIIDALGYLLSASYSEDNYGVVQQTLPEIIQLLLDIKMAEEKMPVGLVGIRTQVYKVKDPQGRYDHIYQRFSLKTVVNNALSRIANTFNDDIHGIDLPEEYQRYFQRYIAKKPDI